MCKKKHKKKHVVRPVQEVISYAYALRFISTVVLLWPMCTFLAAKVLRVYALKRTIAGVLVCASRMHLSALVPTRVYGATRSSVWC